MDTVETKKKKLPLFFKIVLIFLIVLMLLGIGVFAGYYLLRESGSSALKQNISTIENQMDSFEMLEEEQPEADPNLVWHDGKAYLYNENLTTILCMGIDQRSEDIEQFENVSGQSGQADTIFLLVMDSAQKKINIIGISRDTMTDIKTFDVKGNYVGDTKNHLGLAYAFGDGKESSCLNMVDAVSKLFYGLPINAYAAFNMEAISTINDAVGGVPVTVMEDLTHLDRSFVKGATVTLRGEQALKYVRTRNAITQFSNEQRLARQKQYVMSFVRQAMNAVKTDVGIPVKLYQSLTDKIVTNIGVDQVVYLSSEALSYPLDEIQMVSLTGESKRGSIYDEFYVDNVALYKLILDIFYLEQLVDGGV